MLTYFLFTTERTGTTRLEEEAAGTAGLKNEEGCCHCLFVFGYPFFAVYQRMQVSRTGSHWPSI